MTAEQQTQIIEKIPGLIIRDRVMTQYMVDAIRAEPARRFVVFVGNGHTGKVADAPIPGRPSMAAILAPQVKSPLSLNTMAIKYLFGGCLSPSNYDRQEFELPTPLHEEVANRGKGVHMGYTSQDPQNAYDSGEARGRRHPAIDAVKNVRLPLLMYSVFCV